MIDWGGGFGLDITQIQNVLNFLITFIQSQRDPYYFFSNKLETVNLFMKST